MKTIKDIRRDLALSQEKLAEALGVTQATISRWESSGNVPKVGRMALEAYVDRHLSDLPDERSA